MNILDLILGQATPPPPHGLDVQELVIAAGKYAIAIVLALVGWLLKEQISQLKALLNEMKVGIKDLGKEARDLSGALADHNQRMMSAEKDIAVIREDQLRLRDNFHNMLNLMQKVVLERGRVPKTPPPADEDA